MIDAEDLELLREAAGNRAVEVAIEVSGCAYSCCGRGWHRRDGYHQVYRGFVDNFEEAAEIARISEAVGGFIVYNRGIGTLSYAVAVRFREVLGVRRS